MATPFFSKLKRRLINLVRLTTIEPIVFFNFLALPFFHVSQHAILYKSVCLHEHASSRPDDPYACDHLHKYPDLEDLVQKDASAWNMYLSLSYLLPAIASDIFLGAWSDRNGRKVSILIGFAGLIATSVAFIALAVHPYMPLYILVLANIAAGATGYVAIIMISSMAYLTDVVPNKSTLTFRMIIVLGARWAADVIGSFTTSILLKVSNAAITMLFAQGFFALGFFYALLRLYQMPPEKLRKLTALEEERRKSEKAGTTEKEKSAKVENGIVNGNALTIVKTEKAAVVESKKLEKSTGCCSEFVQTCRFVIKLYKEVWRTLVRPRSRHRRKHLFICTAVYFCFMVSEVGLQSGPIMSLYVFHRPFYWTPSALGTYRGVQSVCALVGTVIGALINKYLHLDDTTIMLLSIASGFLHLTLIGLSQWTWMLYAATAIGGFYSLLVPSVKAFLVRLVEPDEVGKALAANGIAADLAFVCSTLVFTNIYSATVASYAGTVFLIGGSTLICCFGAVVWMRIDRRRQERLSEAASSDRTTSPSIDRPIIGAASYSLTPTPPSPEPANGNEEEADYFTNALTDGVTVVRL